LRQERTKIADRFFLGGPLNIRGFQSRGIGPRSTSSAGTYKNDSLGGDLCFAAGFNLFTPFPFLRNYDALKTHFFWNGGFLLPVEPGTSNGQLLNKIASVTPSSTIGFGFTLRTDMCRAELNWVHPVTMYNTDILSTSKLQFGIGMSFL
jgi:outer membrane protein insertion porin family